MAPKRVLVYVDGSQSSLRAVNRALALAERGARVTALHAYPPRLDRDVVSQFEIEPDDLDERFGLEVLGEVGEIFGRAGLEVDLRMAEGPLVDVICRAAAGYDLLIMGERSPFGQLTSLAQMVRSGAAVPLEVVP